MKRFSTTALASLVVAASPLMAQDDDHREMDAHVHGVSTLELAVEDSTLEINLLSPGADIVGFEYVAEREADKDAIEAAIRTMLMPENIVTLPEAAGCRLTEVVAHLHAGEHDHDDMDEHEDDHDHEHDKDDHAEDADHEHDHDHDEGAGHSEFHVSYVFDCAAPEALTTIGFPFFEAFDNAQEIEAQYVTDAGAGSAEIGRDDAELTLE